MVERIAMSLLSLPCHLEALHDVLKPATPEVIVLDFPISTATMLTSVN